MQTHDHINKNNEALKMLHSLLLVNFKLFADEKKNGNPILTLVLFQDSKSIIYCNTVIRKSF